MDKDQEVSSSESRTAPPPQPPQIFGVAPPPLAWPWQLRPRVVQRDYLDDSTRTSSSDPDYLPGEEGDGDVLQAPPPLSDDSTRSSSSDPDYLPGEEGDGDVLQAPPPLAPPPLAWPWQLRPRVVQRDYLESDGSTRSSSSRKDPDYLPGEEGDGDVLQAPPPLAPPPLMESDSSPEGEELSEEGDGYVLQAPQPLPYLRPRRPTNYLESDDSTSSRKDPDPDYAPEGEELSEEGHGDVEANF